MQEKLRRYQDDLRISGMGVIAFGIWSVLKSFLGLFLMPKEKVLGSAPAESGGIVLVLALIMLGMVAAVDVGLRIYVGRCAMAESSGGKKKKLYVAVTIILMVLSAIGLVAVFFSHSTISVPEIAATVIFEGSSIVIMVRLLVSAFRIRSIKINGEADRCS